MLDVSSREAKRGMTRLKNWTGNIIFVPVLQKDGGEFAKVGDGRESRAPG